MNSSDRTLIIIKPDAVRRGLIGQIIGQFENHGFNIERIEMTVLTLDQTTYHYAEHENKPFYGPLVEFMRSGPSVLLVLSSLGAVFAARNLIGPTKCSEAGPFTIRGRLGSTVPTPVHENLVHASDSPESASREIRHFFPTF